MTPPCTTQRAQQSQSRSRFHRVQMNISAVFLWLVKQDWCEAILEQMWGSTSLGLGGVFFELKEQYTVADHPDVSGVASLMECFLQNPGSASDHIDVGQICCLSSNVGEGNVAIHTADGQDCCKRDHESGILETNSFTDLLFSDD